jgi:hypothetical protein
MRIPVLYELEKAARQLRRFEPALRPMTERVERALRPQLADVIRSTTAHLTPFAVEGFRKLRVGRANDGGYVMLDHFDGIAAALSFGIGGDDSWDVAIADRGIPVRQFDHTVSGAPTAHPRCSFSRKRLVATPDRRDGVTLRAIADEQAGDLILKMDVDGDEWRVLDAADAATLSRFRQIVCELHRFRRLRFPGWTRLANRVLAKLAQSHVPVHIHSNNYQPLRWIVGLPVHDVIEVTFVRRRDYKVRVSDETFPTELDQPNRPDRPDHDLTPFLSQIRGLQPNGGRPPV